MKLVRSLHSVAVVAALLGGFVAEANNKKVKESRDWSLWESTVNNSVVCYMQANKDHYYFLIMKTKNSPNVEVMMQTPENKRGVTGMTVTIAGVPNQLTFADINGRKTHYWGIGKNLSSFINQMRTESPKLQVRGVGGSKDEAVEISTRGFGAMLTEMQNRCNNGAGLVNPEMEANFLAAVPDFVNPLTIDFNKATQLRGIHAGAYADANQIVMTQAELANAIKKYQPLTDELNQNRSTASYIQNTSLPQAQSSLAQAQRIQAEGRGEISRIDAQIPGLNTKIQNSQKAHDTARAALAPHEPEFNRLNSGLSGAQSNLSQAQSRLAYIEDRLRTGSQRISSLSYEANTLERSLSQKRNDMSYAQSAYDRASRERSSYNVSYERDRRLRGHFEYSRLQSDLRSADNNLRSAEMQEQQARRERDQIDSQLRQCRVQPMMAEGDMTVAQVRPDGPGFGGPGGPRPPGGGPGGPRPPGGGGPGHGGPGGPRPPGGPGGPVPPTPPAPRDCSHLERSLLSANQNLERAKDAVRSASNQRNMVSSRINQIERQIDNEVNSEYSVLVNREDQARRELDRIANSLRSDESRISQIRYTELPALEREQSSLTNERPSTQQAISQAQADISRINQELTRFKSSTGWDRKAESVQSTRAQLETDQRNLANAQAQKSSLQRQLETAIAQEPQLRAQVDSLNAQLNSLNARANELNRGLANLPAERAPYDARISSLQTNLRARQIEFLNLLR
ncbi:hypothetical protein [Pseudobdellovibrio exovorus]|uniref:Chromosome partition protein Smc n=1 Tax=Pseudobdellovibrio exovorus JSS TaxID=1184267 RepID=M4VBE7_9BACT|nr:hypothetical protein [Pseudobdellovibrio exovorus]AGH96523.1 hypothetical protein A11Q_2307 [Pseudobdellovibrio exovorus JSS]